MKKLFRAFICALVVAVLLGISASSTFAMEYFTIPSYNVNAVI